MRGEGSATFAVSNSMVELLDKYEEPLQQWMLGSFPTVAKN